MPEYIQNYWPLIVLGYSVITLVITPIVIAIINKKTIRFSTANDIIRMIEFKEKRKNIKAYNKLRNKLYRKCFQKQRKYKGWVLWDFDEVSNSENGWFRVINKEGEYLTLKFPEHLTVRRYGYSPNDRIQQGHYILKPNFIENIFNNLRSNYLKKRMGKYFPLLINFLEKIKLKNERIEINELYRNFKKLEFYMLEKMLHDLKNEKQRKDLTDLITIKRIGTEEEVSYLMKNEQ
jgi:hypothetical protein